MPTGKFMWQEYPKIYINSNIYRNCMHISCLSLLTLTHSLWSKHKVILKMSLLNIKNNSLNLWIHIIYLLWDISSDLY